MLARTATIVKGEPPLSSRSTYQLGGHSMLQRQHLAHGTSFVHREKEVDPHLIYLEVSLQEKPV